MAKQNPHITGCRVERPATLAADAQRRADQALLERYQAALRIIDGIDEQPHGEVIRDFVTGRGNQVRPMATRNPPPPRYSLTVIAINVALVVGSILAAAWLVLN
ncbi:MAG: hypothetical protein IPK54_10540 [Dokdonella sp.]|uniref:hypothetical protein n=1 Tax=Dokdonella sp. TaxID=2291710 RepID=UPI0025C44048|nr:hypothetical protein [Dokdonella sp.]MBK8123968.1 hypothetical protein [Dokdonella sp.]